MSYQKPPNQHLTFTMIVGHRNAGKKIASVAIALIIIMFVITLLIGARKKTQPSQRQPLLHPSSLFFHWMAPRFPL